MWVHDLSGTVEAKNLILLSMCHFLDTVNHLQLSLWPLGNCSLVFFFKSAQEIVNKEYGT